MAKFIKTLSIALKLIEFAVRFWIRRNPESGSQHNPNSRLLAPKRLSTPDKFYKRSQGKKTSPSAGVFLAVQPTALSRIVLAFRSVISDAACFTQRCWFFLPAVFITLA